MCEMKFCAELRLPFFTVEDTNGRKFDLDASFSLGEHSTIPKLIVKFLLSAFVLSTLIGQWISTEYPGFYMAYLTRWTLMYHVLYMIFSSLLRYYPLQWTIKATWILFSLASVHGIIVVLLFWFLEYDANFPLGFYTPFTHGGTFLCVLIDGFLINKTPILLKHVVVNMGFAFLYVIWSVIQGLVPVYNPFNEPTESQALYKVLDWELALTMSAVVSLMVIFVVGPIFHILFWGISLTCRKYLEPIQNQLLMPYMDLENEEKPEKLSQMSFAV